MGMGEGMKMIKYWSRKNIALTGPPRSQSSFTASLQRSESTHHLFTLVAKLLRQADANGGVTFSLMISD